MSLFPRAVMLVGLWLLAWGTFSPAYIVSGFAVAYALLLSFPPVRKSAPWLRARPLPILKLIVYVIGQLVRSNWLVTREIVTPGSRVHTGVLAYPVQHPSDEVLTLIANVIALTPGTMTVEATRDPCVIYVHFLLLDDVEQARRSIARLEKLCVAAIGADASGGKR